MKKAKNNLDGILRGTRQPRTQEAGHPYFSVVVQKPAPKPVVIETPKPETRDWYPLILLVVTVALIVGLIVGNKLGWA